MADYIDREAAKDCTEYSRLTSAGIAPNRYADGWNDACCYIRDKLESVEPADVEPVKRWIPCSERLPGNGEDVLCWYECFRFGEYNRMFRAFGIGYQYNGFWGGEVSKGQNAKVLAWMPLPEPPEMDGGVENE